MLMRSSPLLIPALLLAACMNACGGLPVTTARGGESCLIILDDLSLYLESPHPLGKPAKAQFRGNIAEDGVHLQGIRAMRIYGFDLNLTLGAKIRATSLGNRVFRESDIEYIKVHYTDDLLEFAGSTENDIPALIKALYSKEGRAWFEICVLPGGEIIGFSAPMKKLIQLGAKSRPSLHPLLKDERICNEVALILGAIGDETTVPLLIDAYPPNPVKENASPREPEPFRIVCFTFALTYLTGEPIGRSREGTDFDREYRTVWQAWWKEKGDSFRVPKIKPNETWVPLYPLLSEEWAKHRRKQFVSAISEIPQ